MCNQVFFSSSICFNSFLFSIFLSCLFGNWGTLYIDDENKQKKKNTDAIKGLPLTNAPDVIGLNNSAEIAYNKQYIDSILQRLPQCKVPKIGL